VFLSKAGAKIGTIFQTPKLFAKFLFIFLFLSGNQIGNQSVWLYPLSLQRFRAISFLSERATKIVKIIDILQIIVQ
jgi:hypothetical protein